MTTRIGIDNEWGYSCRIADLIALVGSRVPFAA
jgi:hypothetical protein